MKIDVHNSNGIVIKQLEIDDDIEFVDGRVSKGRNCYYKGLGAPYRYQSVTEPTGYELIEKSDVFYMGYKVRKPCFIGKTGIFQEKFQPQFTDYIGTCGVKELSIIENSMFFERSSVRILDSKRHDEENAQYYFKIDYRCHRVKYGEAGNPDQLYELMVYMLAENWNFIWDKNAITDITAEGLVSDVADIFKSNNLESKLGTIYAILYSLAKYDFKKYYEFLTHIGLRHTDAKSFIFNTMRILMDNNVDVTSLLPHDDLGENYKHTVLNHLIVGRNCGHCCYVDLGEQIKRTYIQMVGAQFATHRT